MKADKAGVAGEEDFHGVRIESVIKRLMVLVGRSTMAWLSTSDMSVKFRSGACWIPIVDDFCSMIFQKWKEVNIVESAPELETTFYIWKITKPATSPKSQKWKETNIAETQPELENSFHKWNSPTVGGDSNH